MRIILKPMGLLVILVLPTLAIVIELLLLHHRNAAAAAAAAESSNVVRLTATSGGAAAADAAPAEVVPVHLDPRSLVRNGSFEEVEGDKKPAGWNVDMAGGDAADVSYVETLHAAHSGRYHLTNYGGTDYEVRTTQLLSGLKDGNYELRAWAQSNGGRNRSFLVAKDFAGADSRKDALIPVSEGKWVPVEVHGIHVTSGQCLIGLYSQAKGGQWTLLDDVEFIPED